MKIINVRQNSDEWYELRAGIPTASGFSKIVTSTGALSKSLDEYALQLATDKLVMEREDTYTSGFMEKGKELELEAVSAYQEHTFRPVKIVGFIICGNYGYSPDGLVSDDGLVEIKCPKQTTHARYLSNGVIPVKYIQQVQGGLFVSGRKWIDFISYNPTFVEGKKLFIKRVFRDEEFILKL